MLKPGRQCAILIGDTRRKRHVIPLGFKFINVYLDAGFKLKELVIKRQHNCKTTGFWYENSVKYNFLLLAHEYLPIFEKPANDILLGIREKEKEYELSVPIFEKLQKKKKLDELETTTVWIFPDGDFEECLNRNVIERYSPKNRYSIISLTSVAQNNTKFTEMKRYRNDGLLFIKSAFLNNNLSSLSIEHYLKKIKETVYKETSNIKNGGFLIIQTQDARINGYLESLGKKIADMLSSDNFWLKEIIVATHEGSNFKTQNSTDYLNITHQYLLVYEVKK